MKIPLCYAHQPDRHPSLVEVWKFTVVAPRLKSPALKITLQNYLQPVSILQIDVGVKLGSSAGVDGRQLKPKTRELEKYFKAKIR